LDKALRLKDLQEENREFLFLSLHPILTVFKAC
jgi:hypothetical protein